MYNIDIYSYWKKPFSKQRNFSIHPLDEPGKHKMFFTDESHLVHYLKRTDPFVFKSIVGVDYETLVNQQKEKIKYLEQQRNSTNNFNNFSSTNNINNNNQELNQTNQTNRMHVTNYEDQKQNYKDDNELTDNRLYNDNQILTESRKNRPQSSINSGYRKKKNFKDIYGYEQNTNFKNNADKTLYEINNLKKYGLVQNEDDYNQPGQLGFDSTNIPKFKTNRPLTSTMRNFNNNLARSVGFGNYKNGLDENKKMRNNLFNQTSRAFCQKHKLPDLTKIAGQRQVIRNMKIGNSKEMGEKYFPEAFIPPTKNRTGRNYVGDLFKH